MLTGDLVAANNRQSGSVVVNVHDIAPTAIVVPAASMPPGPLAPMVTLRNHGTVREACAARFVIGSVYSQTVNLPAGLPPGVDTSVVFPNWSATTGSYTATCFSLLPTDQVRSNDTIARPFVVSNADVGVVSIEAAKGSLDTSADVVPAATVRNFGPQASTFRTYFTIDTAGVPVYSSERTVTDLAAGASITVYFDTLPKPHAAGSYATCCSTYIALDLDPTNNVLTGSLVFAAGPPPPPWTTRKPLPDLPSGKQVKDGGWLTFDMASQRLYAAKGNKVSDFYAYDAVTDSWMILTPIPDGREMKKPGKGAIGCAAAGSIYASKGNSTQGFFRYDIGLDSWYQKPDIPLGVTNKKVKGGTGLAYVDLGTARYVYCLKGYKNEFWKYDVDQDTWLSLTEAPAGTSGNTKYDKGSFLAYDVDSRLIYCHKAKYNELFAYDVASDSWLGQLSGMPLVGMMGKTKKSKDGGSGTWLDGALYAFKGGNTQEFWRYSPGDSGGAWFELESLPQVGTTGKKKKVKAGAGLAAFAPGGESFICALKGNKTNEFWLYTPTLLGRAAVPATGHNGVLASAFSLREPVEIRFSPNPLTLGFVTLHCGLLEAGPARLTVYDAAGRQVRTQPVALGHSGNVDLDLRTLSSGVYVACLASPGRVAAGKLVVRR